MSVRSDLKWSQLKVGITVALAAAVLVLVIFALTGESGWFVRKIHLVTYVDDAAGMLPGASVNLEGVGIGNVTKVSLAQHPPDPKRPVEVDMEVTTGHERWLRTNSTVELGTAGPLGETLVNINSGTLTAPAAQDGSVLPGEVSTGISQILVSAHSVIQNATDLEDRMGQILDQVQNGKGAIGKIFYSSELYDRLDAAADNLQTLTSSLNSGKGTLGQLLTNDELYTKVNATLDNMNHFIDVAENGQGAAAKFMNDPSMYNSANALIQSLQKTTDALNSGQGALGALLTDSPTSNKLKDSLDRLNALLTQMQSGPGSAAKFLNDPALYNSLTNLTSESQQLIQAIRLNPKKYLTIHMNIF